MTIRNVDCIFSFNNSIGYATNEKIVFQNRLISISQVQEIFFEFFNSNLFGFESNTGNILLFDLTYFNYIKANGNSILRKFPCNKDIYFDMDLINDNLTKLNFFNFNSEKLTQINILNFSRNYSFYPNIAIVYNNFKSFHLYNFIEKKILWTFSAKELGAYTNYEGTFEGKVQGEIIECQGCLIMELSSPGLNGSKVKFIGLDINSGELIWLKEFPIEYRPKMINFENELIVLGEYYSKMDPRTGDIIEAYFPFFDLIGYYHKILVTHDYVFTGTLKTELKQYSRKSGNVIWSGTLYGEKEAGRRGKTINGNDPLQYADGKLYVLDSEKTLHILDVARD